MYQFQMQGQGSPRYGPEGGIVRRKLGGRDYTLRRSCHNWLIARLCCTCLGSGGWTLVGMTVC